MSPAEVEDLVEIMTAGAPEEQRYPAPVASPQADPPPPRASPKNLGEALARGSVLYADIDRATGRVLGQIERFGWLDHPPRHALAPQYIEANARIIQRTAERGAVLLKNDGVLPLARADLDSLASSGRVLCRPSRSSLARSSPTAARSVRWVPGMRSRP